MDTPRFNIYSGILRAYTAPDGKKHLNTTASSTIKDLMGDEIRMPAIEKMERTAVGMTMFLNHEYRVPEDVLGTVETAKAIQRGYDSEPIVDLDFDVAVNETNPRAVKTWEAVDAGVKLGTSIGAQIPKGGATKKKEGGYVITDINLLEASIVGIPANPRSWVNYATKSLRGAEETVMDEETEPTEQVDKTIDVTAENSLEGKTLLVLPDEVVKSEELDQQVEPDLVEGRTRVTVTVTSDDSSGSQNASPGASENEALLDETADGDTDALGDDVTRSADDELRKAFDTTTSMLQETVGRVETLTKALEEMTHERDELKENLIAAKSIIDRIADLPIGRKATFNGAVTDFRQRFPMYDEDFVKFLER